MKDTKKVLPPPYPLQLGERYKKLCDLGSATERSVAYHIKKAVDKYLEEMEKKKVN